jgi:chemotaxis protein histidine kinase CheA
MAALTPPIQFNRRFADPVQSLLIQQLAGPAGDDEFLREARQLGAAIAQRKAAATREEAEARQAEWLLETQRAESLAADARAEKEAADVVAAERALAELRARNDAAAIAEAEAVLAREKAEAEAAQRAADDERAATEAVAAVAAKERAEAQEAQEAQAVAAEEARVARAAQLEAAAAAQRAVYIEAQRVAHEKAAADAAVAAAAAAAAVPRITVGDLLVESQDPITEAMFTACRDFVSDLSKFERMYDGKAMALYKDSANTAGASADSELTGFVLHAKPAPITAEAFWKIKDEIEFIRSIDKGIMDFEDVDKPSPTTTMVYYSYKMPPGFKNRDFMVQAETRPNRGDGAAEGGGIYESIQRSIDDPRRPTLNNKNQNQKGGSKLIRAFMFNYTRVESVGDGSSHQSVQLFCTDLKGKVPMGVIEKFMSKACNTMVRQRQTDKKKTKTTTPPLHHSTTALQHRSHSHSTDSAIIATVLFLPYCCRRC